MFFQIPAVAISVLILSLIESLYVLPAHLAHKGRETRFFRVIGYPQRHFNPALHRFIERFYTPLVRKASRNRILTLTCGVALLILCGGEIPLAEAADIVRDRSYTSIQRNNGRRIIRVSATTRDGSDISANEVSGSLIPDD